MRTLVVEDSPFCMELLVNMLQKQGIDTCTATNGREALEIATAPGFRVDLVISDIIMPELNGIDFYRALKRTSRGVHLPVILASNAADKNTVFEAAKSGCKHFLVKPLSKETVMQKVRQIFPDLRIYFKDPKVIAKELDIHPDGCADLMDDFSEKLSAAINTPLPSGAHNELEMRSALARLKIGARLLGTDMLFDDIAIRDGVKENEPLNWNEIAIRLREAQTELERARANLRPQAPEPAPATRHPSTTPQPVAKPVATPPLDPKAKKTPSAEPASVPAPEKKITAPTPAPEKEIFVPDVLQSPRIQEDITIRAKGGILEDQCRLGVAYLRGDFGDKNLDEGRHWLELAVKKNFPLAMCELALLGIRRAQELTRDVLESALSLLNPAADQGHRESYYWRGRVKNHLDRNPPILSPDSIYFLCKAEQGDSAAQFHLGVIYDQGEEFPQNLGWAIYWLRCAAEQGHRQAQYRLGLIYDMGYGGYNSELEAIKWFEQAAEQGHLHAQYMLGKMYQFGIGTVPNLAAACHWYEMAAHQGSHQAEYRLGSLLEDNNLLENDLYEALKWYLVSAANGSTRAIRRIPEVEARLSPEDIERCRAEAHHIINSTSLRNMDWTAPQETSTAPGDNTSAPAAQ